MPGRCLAATSPAHVATSCYSAKGGKPEACAVNRENQSGIQGTLAPDEIFLPDSRRLKGARRTGLLLHRWQVTLTCEWS